MAQDTSTEGWGDLMAFCVLYFWCSVWLLNVVWMPNYCNSKIFVRSMWNPDSEEPSHTQKEVIAPGFWRQSWKLWPALANTADCDWRCRSPLWGGCRDLAEGYILWHHWWKSASIGAEFLCLHRILESTEDILKSIYAWAPHPEIPIHRSGVGARNEIL